MKVGQCQLGVWEWRERCNKHEASLENGTGLTWSQTGPEVCGISTLKNGSWVLSRITGQRVTTFTEMRNKGRKASLERKADEVIPLPCQWSLNFVLQSLD